MDLSSYLPQDLTLSAVVVMTVGLSIGAIARGYSGFGFSALLVSSWSLVTDPARAVVVALCLEVAASVMQAFSVWKDIPWKRVGLLMVGAVIGTPLGVYILAYAPREPLKLVIAGFVLVSTVLLLVGFKLKRRSGSLGTTAVGAASGVANGAVAMGGLPVALFLTADGDTPAHIRAAVIAYFFLLDLTGLFFLTREGLVTTDTLSLVVLAIPIVALGVWLGGRQFLGSSPEAFRRTTLLLLLVIATLGIVRALWLMA